LPVAVAVVVFAADAVFVDQVERETAKEREGGGEERGGGGWKKEKCMEVAVVLRAAGSRGYRATHSSSNYISTSAFIQHCELGAAHFLAHGASDGTTLVSVRPDL
jgi:hypothetical protein